MGVKDKFLCCKCQDIAGVGFIIKGKGEYYPEEEIHLPEAYRKREQRRKRNIRFN